MKNAIGAKCYRISLNIAKHGEITTIFYFTGTDHLKALQSNYVQYCILAVISASEIPPMNESSNCYLISVKSYQETLVHKRWHFK